MPRSYAPQFRAMVVDQVRSGRPVAEVASAVEVAGATVYRWMRQDRIDRGELAGTSTMDNAELRAAKRRIAELEAELAIVKRASALFEEGRVVRPKQCSSSWRRWRVRASLEPSRSSSVSTTSARRPIAASIIVVDDRVRDHPPPSYTFSRANESDH